MTDFSKGKIWAICQKLVKNIEVPICAKYIFHIWKGDLHICGFFIILYNISISYCLEYIFSPKYIFKARHIHMDRSSYSFLGLVVSFVFIERFELRGCLSLVQPSCNVIEYPGVSHWGSSSGSRHTSWKRSFSFDLVFRGSLNMVSVRRTHSQRKPKHFVLKGLHIKLEEALRGSWELKLRRV